MPTLLGNTKNEGTLFLYKSPPRYAASIITGLSSKIRRVQNGCAELASLVSAVEPALLAPHVDLFIANLNAEEAVLRWEAACTLGNLAASDKKGKTKAVVPILLGLLDHESIVLQGHAVRALAKIALTFPPTAPKILDGLLRAAPAFPGNRVGYLVEAMESFAAFPELTSKAKSFATKYESDEIESVASKAKRAVKRLSKTKKTV